MKSHFENLTFYVHDLRDRRILDLGSGKGSFLVDAARHGAKITGVEKFDEYIQISKDNAVRAGLKINVVSGVGENIPFTDNSFDFVNMSEVIEHVDNPEKVLCEVFRVLSPGGKAYMSVPNRFSLKDQHFHLYFVNWLPRSLSDGFVSLFGKHKDYSKDTGRQRLRDMHYYTFSGSRRLAARAKLSVSDMRIEKIKKNISNPVARYTALFAYHLLRPWYFDSFHVLLEKKI